MFLSLQSFLKVASQTSELHKFSNLYNSPCSGLNISVGICCHEVSHICNVHPQLEVPVGQSPDRESIIHILTALGVNAEYQVGISQVEAFFLLFWTHFPWILWGTRWHFTHLYRNIVDEHRFMYFLQKDANKLDLISFPNSSFVSFSKSITFTLWKVCKKLKRILCVLVTNVITEVILQLWQIYWFFSLLLSINCRYHQNSYL